jgi:hypothetical protein
MKSRLAPSKAPRQRRGRFQAPLVCLQPAERAAGMHAADPLPLRCRPSDWKDFKHPTLSTA